MTKHRVEEFWVLLLELVGRWEGDKVGCDLGKVSDLPFELGLEQCQYLLFGLHVHVNHAAHMDCQAGEGCTTLLCGVSPSQRYDSL